MRVATFETAKMSERGQIIIPKEVRDVVNAGDSTIFTVVPIDSETIIMKKLDKNKILQEFRGIRNKVDKLSAVEINDEIRQKRLKK